MRFHKLRRLTLIATLALGCLAGGMSSASAQQGEIIIRTAPPAPRYEARGSARAGYEWVPGYWRWERGRHVWVRGHWERARRGWSWHPARWERRHDGWVFIAGRWGRGRYNPGPSDRPPYEDGPRHDGPRHDGPRHDGPYDGPRNDGPYSGRDRGRHDRWRRHWERQGWALLGEQWVSGREDHDYVPIGRRQGRFTRVLLVAEEGDFELHDVVIEFSNGRAWSPRLNHYFREGQRSRTLMLPNAPRGLRSIKLTYGNLPGGGRALVQVWAR